MPDAPNHSNLEIREFLKGMVDSPAFPPFAVMIEGKWGSGKTHFIKSLITDGTLPHAVYVSLHGMSSREDLERSIIMAVNPVITNKKAQAFAKIIGGGMKVFRFDPALTMKDMFDIPSNRVFVFDDIERSTIPVSDSLALISQLMTEVESRSIILSHEGKIADPKYNDIKEKTIGWTLAFESDPANAVSAFISGYQKSPSFKVFSRLQSQVLQTFIKSGYDNLRVLEQSLYDIDHVIKALTPTKQVSDDLIDRRVVTLLAYAIERRMGTLDVSDIDYRATNFLLNKSDGLQRIETLRAKYGLDQDDARTLPNDMLRGFLLGRSADLTLAETIPSGTRSDAEPLWRRLLGYFRTDYASWRPVFDSTIQALSQYEIVEPGEIVHMFSMLAYLSREGALNFSEHKIEVLAKYYVRTIRLQGRLKPIDPADRDELRFGSWGGYTFVGEGESSTNEILRYLRSQRQLASAAALPKMADEFFNRLKNGTAITSQLYEGDLRLHPFLPFLDPGEFAVFFLETGAQAQSELVDGLRTRYEGGRLFNELKAEDSWLNSVKDEIERRLEFRTSFERHRATHTWKFVRPQ